MKKGNRAIKYAILGLLLLAVVIGSFALFRKDGRTPFEKYFTIKTERGGVRHVVTSTGTLQAVVTVQVGSQVSGRIQELHADFNSVVKKGQILAVIDPANFEAQRE